MACCIPRRERAQQGIAQKGINEQPKRKNSIISVISSAISEAVNPSKYDENGEVIVTAKMRELFAPVAHIHYAERRDMEKGDYKVILQKNARRLNSRERVHGGGEPNAEDRAEQF